MRILLQHLGDLRVERDGRSHDVIMTAALSAVKMPVGALPLRNRTWHTAGQMESTLAW